MSKVAAIDRLLASAIEEFSALGYDGASLRSIASSADVTLSMIHRYYGNKAGLIAAAEQKVWTNINAERDERLAEALSRDPPLIEDLMRALIQPVVDLALSSPKGRHMIELLRLSILEHRHLGVQGPTVRDFTATSRRWLASIHKALPEIPGDTLVWAYSFAVGSIYSWQLLDNWYDSVLPRDRDISTNEVTNMLVSFCCGGLKAVSTDAL